MKITILGSGTSQGVPVIACDCEVCRSEDPKDKRLRSSILVENDRVCFSIDAGPDFRQQLLSQEVMDLNAVLFTHEHKDHTAGLDDVRAFNFKYQKDFPVFGEERVFQSLTKEFSYIFSENKYPGIPRLVLHEINNEVFKIGDIEVLPIRVMHGKLPIFGFRIDKMAYITDANHIEEQELKKLEGVEMLILNAVRKEPHRSHYNLEGALEVMRKVEPKKGYLTHISHLMGKHQVVSQELPSNVEIAFDGLVIKV